MAIVRLWHLIYNFIKDGLPMKKPTFSGLIINWFCICLVVAIINAYTLQSRLLYSICSAGLGLYLLIRPVWPRSLGLYWPEDKCRRFIRILALIQIFISFANRISI